MPLNLPEIVSELSPSRLKPYRRLDGVPNTLVAIESMYLLNDVSKHFYVPLQLVEVALRNRINSVIATWSESENWYQTIPCSDESKAAVRQAISYAEGEIRGRSVSPDDVVCRLMFGFWTYMLDKPYRNSKDKSLHIWNHHRMVDAFPGKPAHITVGTVFDRLLELNDLRNRLFHHEPIWKSGSVVSVDDAMNVVSGKYSRLCEMLRWLSPEQAALLNGWGFHGRFQKSRETGRLKRLMW